MMYDVCKGKSSYLLVRIGLCLKDWMDPSIIYQVNHGLKEYRFPVGLLAGIWGGVERGRGVMKR